MPIGGFNSSKYVNYYLLYSIVSVHAPHVSASSKNNINSGQSNLVNAKSLIAAAPW